MKRSLACIIVIGLCCSAAAAQEQKGSALSEWLKGLQQRIALIAPKKTLPQSTMVAGVRGAKEGAPAKLYWKGKKGEEPVTEQELAELRKGLDLAAKGDTAGAAKELEGFLKQYPDSALVPDAKKTLDMVKTDAKPVSENK
jgi:TolA-binding protein